MDERRQAKVRLVAGAAAASLAPPPPAPAWRDAAAGLLPALDAAVPRADSPVAPSHVMGTRTLLFLNAVRLRRTWDLRN